jgi:DNA polymerase
MAELYRETQKCDKCALSQKRAKIVFSSGSADGKLFVIGDAPSRADEAAGQSFQGEAGDLFDKILGKMGLDRKRDVFATYLQKCRNNDGLGGDGSGDLFGSGNLFDAGCAEVCRPILDKQIDIIDPKAILIFGSPPAKIILGDGGDIEQLRGADHKYKDKPVVVTYPLSLMLEDTKYRYGAWDDMKKVLKILG